MVSWPWSGNNAYLKCQGICLVSLTKLKCVFSITPKNESVHHFLTYQLWQAGNGPQSYPASKCWNLQMLPHLIMATLQI